jgi:asparagine synthase (glutamine-hydrolysing)
MCGICGAFLLDPSAGGGEALPREVLDRMNDAMAHRGPDDAGVFAAPGVGFGARRLSIVDVEGGHQPFGIAGRDVWGMQNGEIFNHVTLREELRRDGFAFRSRCDTEILPALYVRDGLAFPKRLRGMFAVAVWDGRERRGVLVRDRLGIKPLYYAVVEGRVLFASELKCLLASGLVPLDLDHVAIDAYLSLGFVPGAMTPLAHVRRLEPGHLLVVEDGRVRVERWWRYPAPRPEPMSREEASHRLLAMLRESVKLRLMSDVPLGAMLSGGLDSSLIVGLMADEMSDPVQTFSVGLAGSPDNELGDARDVARHFGADHHELELRLDDESVDLAELVWHLDEPLADLSAVGFLALCKLAREHVTVALSGQGADELLGGYRKHKMAALVDGWQRIPGPGRRAGEAVAGRLSGRLPAQLVRATDAIRAADPAERLLASSSPLDPELRGRLVRGALAGVPDGNALALVRGKLDGVTGALPAALYLDAQLGLVDDMLTYFDRSSMAHSLEVRVPFLDHHLVELCATIPPEHKVHRLDTKHVLKEAARGLVPDRIIDKPKIGFFNSAVQTWFAGQTRGAVQDYLLAADPRYAELLSRDVVRDLVAEQGRNPERGRANLLLALLMLEVWLREYLPRATAAARVAPVGPAGSRRAAL